VGVGDGVAAVVDGVASPQPVINSPVIIINPSIIDEYFFIGNISFLDTEHLVG
jgi:hypothetical protein